jgi:cobalt-zinc-cadmium efflux system protein
VDFGRAFLVGIVLNTAFVVVEVGFGILGNSMALIADAGHNLSDVLALVVAWVAARASTRPPSARFTYGLSGSSILAALFNAVFLLVAVGAIALEAVQRLLAPEPVAGLTMVVVAGIGILINGATALLFHRGAADDLNIRGVYLHMATDAAISAGVVAAGLAVLATGLTWIDPAVSLVVAIAIVWSTWGLLAESSALSVAAVPAGIDPAAVRAHLADLPGVTSLHDLHVWGLSTTASALTAHLVMPAGHPGDGFLEDVAETLRARFGIGHVTLQIETDGDGWCRLVPDEVV